MTIYFTADTHFNHTKIMEYEQRPYSSIEEMNQKLIQNWNETVRKIDDIYILGDFAFGKKMEVESILRQLNGRKYLIKGNHDHYLKDKSFDASYFEWIKDYHKLKYNKQKFLLFHYPIQSWESKHHGSIHLFGHVHRYNQNDRLGEDGFCFNVGVDVNGFTPVSIDSILEKYNKARRI